MKNFLLFFWLVNTLVLFAAPPEIIQTLQKQIERETLAWKVASVEPLSKTLKTPIAKDGWRLILQRPLESQRTNRYSNIVRAGEKRNTAELIFLAGSPDVKTIRSELTWLNEPGELRTVAVYLGKKWQFDIFLRADIATISAINNLIQAQGGDDLYRIYAEALNMRDYNDTTRKAAASLLPAGGTRILPFVNRAIGTAIALDIDTAPHFVVLKRIGTPEVASLFISAYRSKIPPVIKNVEESLLIPPAQKGCEQIYFSMLQQKKWLNRTIVALEELGCQQKMLPMLRYLRREPESFEQFAILVFAEARCISGKKENPEFILAENIRLLLARIGDIPGTPKFISVSKNSKNLEAEALVSERKRLEPLEREFAKSRDVDSAVCSALMLCMFKPVNQTYNKDYIKRVNDEGVRLLKMLPRGRVRSILRVLRDNVEDPKESELFRKIMIQVG